MAPAPPTSSASPTPAPVRRKTYVTAELVARADSLLPAYAAVCVDGLPPTRTLILEMAALRGLRQLERTLADDGAPLPDLADSDTPLRGRPRPRLQVGYLDYANRLRGALYSRLSRSGESVRYPSRSTVLGLALRLGLDALAEQYQPDIDEPDIDEPTVDEPDAPHLRQAG